MRAEPWPDETVQARFHSGVIIPPQAAFRGMAQQEAWTAEKYRRFDRRTGA
jgi:hypothetical protein